MLFTAVWIHAVWATHQRQPWLKAPVRPLLFQHLREQAQRHAIHLTAVGGWTDHVHVLFALSPDQQLAKGMQLLKGESSYWLNKVGVLPGAAFQWQAE